MNYDIFKINYFGENMIEKKLDGKSNDILHNNLELLKELFPEIVTEEKINFKMFKTIFSGEIDDSSEIYTFTWPGKTQAIKESQKQSTGTLRPYRKESKNWDITENLYIEGDNLEVLKLLQKGYYNKIKMIYIDPPYNRGRDSVYKDNYKDNLANYLENTNQIDSGKKLTTNTESNGRFHSIWLNMMYPRLKLARNLLKEDGIIFISIDDNELNNLKTICDEIFGPENFIAILPTVMNLKGNNDQFGFAGTNEYTLVFVKCKDVIEELNGLPLNEEEIQKYDIRDEKGYYKQGATLMRTGEAGSRKLRPKGFYPIYVTKDFKDLNIERKFEDDYEVFPLTKNGKEMSWRRSKENLMNTKDEIIIKNNNGNISFYKKQRLEEDMKKGKKPKTLFYKPEYSSGNGTQLIKELFGDRIFDNPKPIQLIKDFIKIGSDENDIILDFFSGSATTAHSVLELNNEYNNHHRFIMVQLPEIIDMGSEAYHKGYSNICEIGKERIRRAGDKIVQESGNKNLDIGFKVFKLDSSNLNKWDPDYDNLEQTLLVSQENIKPDRTQEDLIYEIMLKYGIDLTLPIEEYNAGENKIYSIGFGALLICLDNKITKDITDPIIELASEDVSRVVFKDNGFASDADKTNIKETLRTHNIDEFITI